MLIIWKKKSFRQKKIYDSKHFIITYYFIYIFVRLFNICFGFSIKFDIFELRNVKNW